MARKLPTTYEVDVAAGHVRLTADLLLASRPAGIVVFAHGSGSGRRSPRNRVVADTLVDAGLSALLIDLLTTEEAAEDAATLEWRFDIELLARRVTAAIDWLAGERDIGPLPLGCFGASTGAAAALIAAAARPGRVAAVVSRGGRPDLAADALARVDAATLLIVGGDDRDVVRLNREAAVRLPTACLEIIPGAGHLFEEPGTLERVGELTVAWCQRHLRRR